MISMHKACVAAIVAVVALGACPDGVMAIDLPAVLQEIAAKNPTLQARRSGVEAAAQRIGPAGAWPAPMVTLGAMNVPESGRFDQEPMTQKQIGLMQRVPVFGRTGLARRSAEQGLGAEEAATELTHFELYGMAWEVYAAAFYAGERARVAHEHQAVMVRLVASAQARYESGVGRLEDVLRARAERARTLADLEEFGAEVNANLSRLDALRGRDPGAARDSLAPPPLSGVPPSADSWLAAVGDPHPRLRELGADVARHRYAARTQRRSVWPDLELRLAYGIREPLGSRNQQDMWTATVGFALPVFSGQREYARAREMDAMARAAESRRRAERLRLGAEVEALHAQGWAAQRTVRLLADTVVVTQRQALEASWSAYRSGLNDLWRALEAAHTLYLEEVALTRARQRLAQTQARFIALTGRGDVLGVALPDVVRNEP